MVLAKDENGFPLYFILWCYPWQQKPQCVYLTGFIGYSLCYGVFVFVIHHSKTSWHFYTMDMLLLQFFVSHLYFFKMSGNHLLLLPANGSVSQLEHVRIMKTNNCFLLHPHFCNCHLMNATSNLITVLIHTAGNPFGSDTMLATWMECKMCALLRIAAENVI